MNPAIFFQRVRATLFHGRLNQQHVQGMESLIRHGLQANYDLRLIAYVLGTAYHETAFTMYPIEEIGRGRNKPYGQPDNRTGQAYYGRGFVQLTWYENYEAMSPIVGGDLLRNPGRALDLDVATVVIWEGMMRGMFSRTGEGLATYFPPNHSDWVNARRTVNGLDRAARIANYSTLFWDALLRADGRQPASFAPMANVSMAGLMDAVPDDPIEVERLGVLAEDSLDDLDVNFN